jgi:hypothetical protein
MLIAAVLRPTDEVPADRRAFRRQSVSFGANFDFDGMPEPVSCIVVDVSAGGAQLMGRLPEGIREAKLEIEGLEPLPCEIIWRTESKVGIRFLRDPKDVANRLAKVIKGE